MNYTNKKVRRNTGIATGFVLFLWLLFVLFDIGVTIAVIFIALHFIRKWW